MDIAKTEIRQNKPKSILMVDLSLFRYFLADINMHTHRCYRVDGEKGGSNM